MSTRILFLACLFVSHFDAAKTVALAADHPFPEHDIQSDDDLLVEQVLSDPLIAQPMEVKFDERNRMWVVEYRQYPKPAGIEIVDRDEYWRVQYDRMAPPPPHAEGSPFRGKDRISIHTDTNNDGHYDEHKTFVEGLNITTSIAFDGDGVWVLTPPYLVFYPDADKDDVPDGDPIVHLRGFGIEDTHSIANSLTWGPDGWLYGGNGSTSTMSVTSPFWNDDRPPVARKGQNIWRYHPITHVFEVFAEGGGNTFGLEIDAAGHVYSGHNGGDTRGFHFVKGGYYRKSFGKHGDLSNPNALGYFGHIEHHKVERFSHHFLIYDAVELPERFHNQLIGIDVLHRDLVLSDIQQNGSTFKTKDLSRPVSSDGEEFSPVDLTLGLDGYLYIADWADSAVSHLMNREGLLEPETGRVFRVRTRGENRSIVSTFNNDELVKRLQSPNREVRRTALRLLRERSAWSVNRDSSAGERPFNGRDDSTQVDLETLRILTLNEINAIATDLRALVNANAPYALDALWALHAIGQLTRDDTRAALDHSNPDIRRWAVRLADESIFTANELRERFAQMAAEEPDVGVAVEILAAIRDWVYGNSESTLEAMTARSEFASDTFFPLMLWWAVESTRPTDSVELVEQFQMSELAETSLYREVLQKRIVQMLARDRNGLGWDAIAVMLQNSKTPAARQPVFDALQTAFTGGDPPKLSLLLDSELANYESELSLDLRLRLGREGATSELLTTLPTWNTSSRRKMLSIVSETRPRELQDPLLAMAVDAATNESLRQQLIATLAAYDAPHIGTSLVRSFGEFDKSSQTAVIELLASRSTWSTQLMGAIEAQAIDRKLVTPLVANRIRMHSDKSVVARAEQMWPAVGVDQRDIAADMHRYTRRLTVGHRGQADRGAAVFKEHCATCHKLYDVGKTIGPDLTSYQRSNRELMLLALVAPSAEIREGFETAIVILDDGSVLTGILIKDNDSLIELKDNKGTVRTIERSRIETLKISPTSLMPAGQIDKLSDQNLRDLFAYLQKTT